MMNNGKLNTIFIFRSLVLVIYSVFFLHIIISGSISKYVHPRYNIFIIISCVITGFIIIAMLISLRLHSHNKISALRIILLILPLLLAYATRNMDQNYSDQFSSGNGEVQSSYTEQRISFDIPAL